MDRVEASVDQQGIDLSANECIAASRALQHDLALDRRTSRSAIGMEVSRSVIAFDQGDGAAGL